MITTVFLVMTHPELILANSRRSDELVAMENVLILGDGDFSSSSKSVKVRNRKIESSNQPASSSSPARQLITSSSDFAVFFAASKSH